MGLDSLSGAVNDALSPNTMQPAFGALRSSSAMSNCMYEAGDTMKAVQTRATVTVAVEHGRRAIELRESETYVLHDQEVASGQRAQMFAQVQDLPSEPIPYAALTAAPGRIIVPFIGGLGDAISILPVLNAIQHQAPEAEITIATTPGPAEVFTLWRTPHALMDYPVTLDTWSSFDTAVSFDAVHQCAPGDSLPHTFASAVGVTLNHVDFDLAIPDGLDVADLMPPSPKVGVVVGDGVNVRPYPRAHLEALVARLNQLGIFVLLLGNADPRWSFRIDPGRTLDLRGETPNVLTLAACVRELDAVIAHDSFIMHLAGALGIPTVGLFAPTSDSHAADYRQTTALRSALACAPCHQTGTTCPQGHDRCVAWDDDAVSPEAVVEASVRLLTTAATSS
ncbi:MAG: glycosyltransferase family 9 protein [Planctomycetota bacterium]